MNARTRPASALLLASLTAALLAAAAGAMLMETRSARAASNESLRLARAELWDQALLAAALQRIDTDPDTPRQGTIYAAANGAVERQDAAGLVDINAAQPDVLAKLFAGLGAAPDRAVALGDAIADWRDGDSLKRLHGAEAEDYVAIGLPPPANRPFAAETELGGVIGVDAALLTCVLPYITVFSGSGDLDANAAAPALAHMLALPPSVVVSAPLGGVIILRATTPLSAHAMLARTIWVRLSGDAATPFLIHRASQELIASAAASPRSDCAEAHP